MRKKIVPLEQEPDINLTDFEGLSGLRIRVDTAHCDAGRQATLFTGEHVQILGFVPFNFFNTMAVRLANGKITAVAPEELQFEEACKG